MNRKTFLATIAAILSAPFVKAKEKEPDWKKANPVLMTRRLDENTVIYYEPYVEPPYPVEVIRPDDLQPNKLPRDRPVEVEDVEKYVRDELTFRLKLRQEAEEVYQAYIHKTRQILWK